MAGQGAGGFMCAVVLACATVSDAQAYSQIVAFGDSLSDSGNAYARFNGIAPAAPYQNGRFSDGPVAVEVLASQLGLTLDNRAIGGALTGFDNQFEASYPIFQFTGLGAQVMLYTQKAREKAGGVDASALYFLWGGANDFVMALTFGNLLGLNLTTQIAANNLSSEVRSLYQSGARDFLVPLMPDLGLSYFATSGLAPRALLTALSDSFNTVLRQELDKVQAASPGLNLTIFDTPAFSASVRTSWRQVVAT